MQNHEWFKLAIGHKKQSLLKDFEESVSQEAAAEWALAHVSCPNCGEHALQFIGSEHVGCMSCCEVVC